MISKIKNRLAAEQGFTLIELLVVIVILGILVAIAVPSYLAFRGNAQTAAAKSNVRSAIPAAESYYQSHNSSYTDMDVAGALNAEAPGVSPDVAVTVSGGGQAYCLDDVAVTGHEFYYIAGDVTDWGAAPTGDLSTIASGTCSAKVTP